MSDLAGPAEKSPFDKITLRTQLLTARRSRSAADRAVAATQLHDHILALVRRATPRTIAAYVPSGPEPGGPTLPDLLRAALPPGGRLLLPVLLPDNDLDWAEYTGSLTPASRGLHEPTGPRLGVTALTSADLILVPALAVGRDGIRMGRGGGSYDRALSRLPSPGPLVVALLHDGEILDRVPSEPHDRPVHGVLTPSAGFIACPA
ncbi:5-formyltetrahydrofolate cyclo-ligase [Actinoplanes sp. SE50]|uniref:5-formyltetrahydrofolate cyclo-ligase n=1 Tax=unclassified Actinoplanes TaxID=2626549 RepID=UPI00023EDE0F|nr:MULTISPECIES: 5-formyltetrahydrofolate cyclo-ligase [unclassified Actinoplanes]AEV88693.1 5-formyltetrahydrofolate cyclo-ligase [Actinoplanes sp. SE50/110]ATO87097.1 5-formyltetrahydrofolate cyclo-ligase [Actinoplanes sp. SE50]SLM04515.1 5-formyltetrahydrofolate cyclo-ligase [Actinoplanes sp. SE50/110]